MGQIWLLVYKKGKERKKKEKKKRKTTKTLVIRDCIEWVIQKDK